MHGWKVSKNYSTKHIARGAAHPTTADLHHDTVVRRSQCTSDHLFRGWSLHKQTRKKLNSAEAARGALTSQLHACRAPQCAAVIATAPLLPLEHTDSQAVLLTCSTFQEH